MYGALRCGTSRSLYLREGGGVPGVTLAILGAQTAYVSIRQHTSAYVSIRHLREGECVPGVTLSILGAQPSCLFVFNLRGEAQDVVLQHRQSVFLLLYQKASTFVLVKPPAAFGPATVESQRHHPSLVPCDVLAQHQYLYFCTSKASKVSTCEDRLQACFSPSAAARDPPPDLCR